VQVKPNVRRFQGSSVEFYDGSIVEDVDLVVRYLLHTLIIYYIYSIYSTVSTISTVCAVEYQRGPAVFQVFATGYSFSFPFLSSSVLPVSGNKAALYKYVFPPALDRSTLAVIGLVQPLGAIMPISEMQARWATRVFKGQG